MLRETAEAVAESLAEAGLELWKVCAVLNEAESGDLTRQEMVLVWGATGTTAQLTDELETAYPDLIGPDQQFRTPSQVPYSRRLGKDDISVMRAGIARARDCLDRVAQTIGAAVDDDPVEKERWMERNAASIDALDRTLKNLASP